MRRQIDTRIEGTLVAEARLAGSCWRDDARRPRRRCSSSTKRPIGFAQLLGARVTFIAADGRVVGDSSEPLEAVPP
jgi:hypothetical protein